MHGTCSDIKSYNPQSKRRVYLLVHHQKETLGSGTLFPLYPPPELPSDLAPAMRNMSQNIFVCMATLARTPFPFYSPCDWLVGNRRWLGIPCCDFLATLSLTSVPGSPFRRRRSHRRSVSCGGLSSHPSCQTHSKSSNSVPCTLRTKCLSSSGRRYRNSSSKMVSGLLPHTFFALSLGTLATQGTLFCHLAWDLCFFLRSGQVCDIGLAEMGIVLFNHRSDLMPLGMQALRAAGMAWSSEPS